MKKSYMDSEEHKHLNNKESERTIRVVHLNIEDLTRAKFKIFSKIFNHADVLAL